MWALLPVSIPTYRLAWSVGLITSAAVRFGVIYEIFSYIFAHYPVAARMGRPLLRLAGGILLVSALVLTVYAGGYRDDPVLFVTHVFDRTASILQCGLLVALFGFSGYFGLSWRNHVFGIALGMGVLASVELASAAVLSATGSVFGSYLDLLRMATYHACVLTWIVYLWRPEVAPSGLDRVPGHAELEIWGDELQHLTQQR
jgi:hypothetical protein